MAGQSQVFRTPRTRVIKYQTIEDASLWPKAESGKCSIFEAINQIGAAKFGSEWTNTELCALYWPAQPAEIEAQHMASLRLRPVRKPLPPPITLAKYQQRIAVPEDEDHCTHVLARAMYHAKVAYERAVADEQRMWEENAALLPRLINVAEWLAQQCRDGRLQAHYRFAVGGALFPMSPADWNVDNALQAFVVEGGYKRLFMSGDKSNQWPVYIFLEREQLAQVLSTFAHAPVVVATTSIGNLSPYLQLAVKLALEKRYNSGANAETQPVREAEVKAAWDAALPGVPRSETAIQAIAKVMGFPNPTAILQGQTRIRSGKG